MKEINVNSLEFNPFKKIGNEWFLISSGNSDKWNTMTASWGFMGVMWNKNCVQAVVRPNRYTYEFLGSNELFTVSFFDEKYRSALSFCGSHSGRSCNKAEETGLTPLFTDGTVTFEEASLVLVCKKIFTMPMDASAIEKSLNEKFNSDAPVHTEFIGEIIKAYSN